MNGLVYFDQFSLIPPLHLGLVVLGIFVLLGGVWVVSIQSTTAGASEGDPWSDEESVEGANSDVESVINVVPDQLPASRDEEDIRPPPVARSRSEVNVHTDHTLASLPERELRSPQSTVSTPLPSAMSPTTARPSSGLYGTSQRRPRSRHLRAQTENMSAPVPNPVAALGAGFQIGLSPVSPGFGVAPTPRERGRILSGVGMHTSYAFGDVVEQATARRARERRRRTVSEGDVMTRGLALERAELLEAGRSRDADADADAETETGVRRPTSAKARWRWLSTLFER